MLHELLEAYETHAEIEKYDHYFVDGGKEFRYEDCVLKMTNIDSDTVKVVAACQETYVREVMASRRAQTGTHQNPHTTVLSARPAGLNAFTHGDDTFCHAAVSAENLGRVSTKIDKLYTIGHM